MCIRAMRARFCAMVCRIDPRHPKAAEAVGISTVYQEVNLIPHLSVAENICLGREPTRLADDSLGHDGARATEALARLELKLDVWQEFAAARSPFSRWWPLRGRWICRRSC